MCGRYTDPGHTDGERRNGWVTPARPRTPWRRHVACERPFPGLCTHGRHDPRLMMSAVNKSQFGDATDDTRFDV
jgi:hypothetical protein